MSFMLRSRVLSAGYRARGPLLAAGSAIGCGAALASTSPASECAFFSSTPKVHLRYFGLSGVAETIRHVMALGKIEWTEDGCAQAGVDTTLPTCPFLGCPHSVRTPICRRAN